MRFSLLLRPLPERIARLSEVTLFTALNQRELGIVGRLLHDRDYQKNEIIFDEGEEGQALYLVFAGTVSIRRKGKLHAPPLAELGPGSFFGDLALLDNAPRAAEARADTDCRLGILFRADLQKVLETDPKTASKIYHHLARHVGKLFRETVLGARGEAHL